MSICLMLAFMRSLPLFAVPFLLVGCVASPISADGAVRVDEQQQTQPEPVSPAVECLTVTDATIAGIQWGIDERQSGLTVESAVAVVNPAEGAASWFVAAEITGPGLRDETFGVWNTLQDPTIAEGDSIAFVSVDSVAAEFSVYVQPDGFSAAVDGANDAAACLR